MRRTTQGLFEKLARQERAFFDSEFLSPVLRNQPIRVKLEGIIQTFKVLNPKDYQGWGIFKGNVQKEATLVRAATLAERHQYLRLYPKFTTIVCQQERDRVLSFPAYSSDNRIKITGAIPIALTDNIRIFDSIDVRWDGATFWYEAHSVRRDLRISNYLREALASEASPDKLDAARITGQDLQAYSFAYDKLIASKKDMKEERLKTSIIKGGGKYRGYREVGDTYLVEYSVTSKDGKEQRLTSTISNNNNLDVVSAGICLSGGDRHYDLQSLVTVVREGMERNSIVVGNYNNYGDNDYYDFDE